MTEQNINPALISKSCLALSDTLDRLLSYLEQTFDLLPEEAIWLLAGVTHNQPQIIDMNPSIKEQYASLAQQIKANRANNEKN